MPRPYVTNCIFPTRESKLGRNVVRIAKTRSFDGVGIGNRNKFQLFWML